MDKVAAPNCLIDEQELDSNSFKESKWLSGQTIKITTKKIIRTCFAIRNFFDCLCYSPRPCEAEYWTK